MSNLVSLIHNFQSNLSYYKSSRYNETETRREFIDPFFSLLGWDMDNSKGLKPRLREVMPENYLSSIRRPDYAFTLSGIKKFFVEAKKPSINILNHTESIFQARSYGWSAEHLIVVLTNFEYLMIYDCTISPAPCDSNNVALLKQYHFSEYIDKFDEIENLLSRDTVYNGQFEKNFEPLIGEGAKSPINDYFLKQINTWREQLSNYLYFNHPDYSLDLINDLTQTFINQMIFLRICEDRNLPLYHNLQQTLDETDEFKNNLQKIFEEADRKYNSGLFEGKCIIFDLSNEIIIDMIKSLYYPQSPYTFNVIESNLLGKIYELFLCEKLTLSNNKVVLSKKDENSNRDIVNTPYEIVRYMVNKTLDPLTAGKSPYDILEIRVADISCGSGVFLLESFDFLIHYVAQWHLDNNIEYLIPGENGQFNLPYEDKRNILISCIYGIDIDPNAVEIAKFSLLIKLIEDETGPTLGDDIALLPNLDNNIKAGNSLIDFRNIRTQGFGSDTVERIFPFNWQFAFNTKTFDAIVGNPPYVATEDMINLLPKEEFEVYKKYQTAYKQFDKYYLFIERGLEKLNTEGVLCFIIPNKFTNNKSGEKLRELITTNKYVSEFIDFGSVQMFKNKTTYSSILLLKKEAQNQFAFEEVYDLQEWWAGLQVDSLKTTNRVMLNSDILSESEWLLVTDKRMLKLIEQLYKNTVPMATIAEPFNGIQTSAERPTPIYWFSYSEIIDETEDCYRIKRNNKVYLIEKRILKPYFKPTLKDERGISTYDLVATNKWIIFPYDDSGKVYTQEIMQSKFPNTWDYLLDNYDKLLPKQFSNNQKGRDMPHATPDTWYHYGRIQHLTSFINNPKLVIRVLRDRTRPLYFYDENDMLIAAGGTAGYCAISKKYGSRYDLEYIQAVFSHPAIEWLFSKIGSDFRGGYYSTGTYILEKFPIRKIDFENNEEVGLYNEIINSARKIYEINKELFNNNFPIKREILLKNEKDNLISLIKDCVTRLYDIENYSEIIN